MTYLVSFLISLLSAIIGGSLVVLYDLYISKIKEKAVLILLAEEFIILFSRCSMYYKQMLKGSVSFSTLFEISDSLTVTKLAEVTKSSKMIETTMELKSWFFQVIRYADKASEELGSGNKVKASEHQGRAMAFFMGEVEPQPGKFDRLRYKDYYQSISSMLDYLEELNSPGRIRALLIHLIRAERRYQLAVDKFISDSRKRLDERRTEIEHYRELEKSAFQKAKGSRTPFKKPSKK